MPVMRLILVTDLTTIGILTRFPFPSMVTLKNIAFLVDHNTTAHFTMTINLGYKLQQIRQLCHSKNKLHWIFSLFRNFKEKSSNSNSHRNKWKFWRKVSLNSMQSVWLGSSDMESSSLFTFSQTKLNNKITPLRPCKKNQSIKANPMCHLHHSHVCLVLIAHGESKQWKKILNCIQ